MVIKFLGTPVRFTFQSLFLVLIFGYISASYLSSWAEVFVFTVLAFICLLLHERAHVAMAAKYGIKCNGIEVMFLGAGAHLEHTGKTPRQAFWVGFVGPLSSCVLGLLTLGLAIASPDTLVNIFALLTSLNILLAIFNILPLYPLDGGRVAHAIFWKFKKNEQKGRILAAKLSKICIIALTSLALAAVLIGWYSWFGLFWIWLIFFKFLWPMADAEVMTSKLSDKKFKYRQTVYVRGEYPPIPWVVIGLLEKPEEKYILIKKDSGGWFKKVIQENCFEYELEAE